MINNTYLIVGLGSIGKRHLKNLRQLKPDAFIVVLRTSVEVTKETPVPEFANAVAGTLEDALEHLPKAAIIATPASHHISIASKLAKSGIHLMIEKPISNQEDNVASLIQICRDGDLALLVAYNFRFSKIAQQFKAYLNDQVVGDVLNVCVDTGQFLPDWRPGTDFQKGVSAKAELGGGAVLELSHEFDFIRWFFGEIREVYAKTSNTNTLGIEVEDCVDAFLTTESGVVVNVHLDFIQRSAHRTCKVIGAEGTLLWDAIHNTITLSKKNTETLLFSEDSSTSRNEMYIEEIQHFLTCIEGKEKPWVSGENGLATLRLALAVKKSSIENLPIEL